MSEFPIQSELDTSPGSNLREYSVSELSRAVKRRVEEGFERVRVRGEVSGFKRAASGHLYMRLKDENAVLDGVCWRGVAGRLGIQPEDGMDVVAIGRLTTYPGRSSYQIVIESLELAGEGALLKLLEERRRKLAAEGLFAEERKQALPFLPAVIGVATSPTGAVIRDILHRLAERFPRRVLVWPVAVQGESAAGQIAAAIEGFNRLEPGARLPRPDLLIVARGGGSLEDLWAFNEEIVVRAAASSEIPLISAVGHETDTTLIDYAADRRAPTPTAAAEIAVPVRAELIDAVLDLGRRLAAAPSRRIEDWRHRVEGLARGLPDPQRLLAEKSQRLDDRAERLANAAENLLQRRRSRLAELGARLPDPRQQTRLLAQAVGALAERLGNLRPRLLRPHHQRLEQLDAARALRRSLDVRVNQADQSLKTLKRLLESTSYQNVLARGFAVVRGPQGLVTEAGQLSPGTALDIEFKERQHVAAITTGETAAVGKSKRAKRSPAENESQGRLL